ncbi:rho GTPase-activating protein 22-like [Emydura macquarii macquarii]|uniref:rho GTPase-activating protein 22-like n=1 Tax=Emydura macquarii macquarii TaxID=1129001 RepID=UPI003529E22B
MPRPERRELAEGVGRHLRSTGVRFRCWKPSLSDSPEKSPPASPAGLFGIPLQTLPLSEKAEGVPQFLVEICEALRQHLHTEGLFRKSGSVTRIKALKAQLEAGESCLDAAAPCDLAALLKQFLRELPQPLIPAELQEPLCRTQQHPAKGERGPLTLLLSCLLPRRSARTLRYFCTFLWDVAARCHENKMDEANLAVVFAPNLFPSCEPSRTPGAERQLQLQAGAVQVLISHAPHIGRVPQFLLDKLSASATERDSGCRSPTGPGETRDELAELNHQRSVGDIVNEVLTKLHVRCGAARPLAWEPGVDSPSSSTLAPQAPFGAKRKALEELAQEADLGTKKRRPAVGPDGSDLSTDEAGDPFNRLPDDAPVSPPEVFADSLPELPSTAGSLPPSTGLRPRKSSCKRRPQRKLSRQSTHGSPAPCERQNAEHKSLRIFACGRKELSPTGHAAPNAKASEPSSWRLVKRMVAEALEGHRFPQGRAWLPSQKRTESDDGAPAGEDPSSADGQSKLDPVPWAGPASAKELDLDAWCGSHGRGPLKQQRVLRRSLSWPEGLAGVEGGVAPEAAGSGSSPSCPGGGEAELLNPSPGSQPSLRPHGTPIVCVTLAPGHLGTGEGSLEPEKERPAPGSLAQRLPCPNSTPKRHVKKLMLAFPRSPAQPAGVSAPKQVARGRRFGRSLSHESALPSGVQAQTSGQGDPGLQPPKSPLSSFRAYGRQIFVSHKHLTLSFAGLRGPRKLGNAVPHANPQDVVPACRLPTSPSCHPQLQQLLRADRRRSPKSSLPATKLTASQGSMDL